MGKHKTRKQLIDARKLANNAFPTKLMATKSFFIVAGIALTLFSVVYFSLGTPEITRSERDAVAWYDAKEQWSLDTLAKDKFALIAESIDIDRLKTDYLKPLLVPRPSGSDENKRIQEFIADTMTRLGWTAYIDRFSDKIPSNKYIEFGNVIATLNPKAKRKLVVACHHDSKITPVGFIGAIDSAVPCAMMMEIAKALGKYFSYLQDNDDLTLQYIFFDGEEAFERWTDTDSIYGARHLAKKWSTQSWPDDSSSGKTILDSIDQLVLLDLLGAKDPTFQQTRSVQSRHFQELKRIEEALLAYEKKSLKNSKRYFTTRVTYGSIGDDHVPFLERGVPVLHIIPTPFPRQWHNMRDLEDTEENLDYPTIKRLSQIMAVYIAEYLHLVPEAS